MPLSKPTARTATAVGLVIAASILLPATEAAAPPTSAETAPVASVTRAIVDDYRRIIVLLADASPAEADPDRAPMVGQYLFFRNLSRAETLTQRLTAELTASASSPDGTTPSHTIPG